MTACTRFLLKWMWFVYYWMLRYVSFGCVQDSCYHIWLCWRTGNWYIALKFAQVGEWCGRVSHINLKWERKLKKRCFNVCFSCWCDSIFNHFIIFCRYFLQRHLPRISFCLVANIVWQLEAFLCGFQKLRNWLSMCEKFFAGTVNCFSLGCFIFNDCKPNGAYRISCCGLLYKFIGERHWKMLLMCNNAWITFTFL